MMRSRLVRLTVAALATAGAVAASASDPAGSTTVAFDGGATEVSWSLVRDFRLAPHQANPAPDRYGNAGVWRYESAPIGSEDEDQYGQFVPLPVFYTDRFHVPGLQSWSGTVVSIDEKDLLPHVSVNATGRDQALFDGALPWPAWTAMVHPWEGEAVAAAWRSPVRGYVRVVGYARMVQEPNCGGGVRWWVRAGGTVLRSGFLPDTQDVDGWWLRRLPVWPGRTVRLVVTPNGDELCDSTVVGLRIAKVS